MTETGGDSRLRGNDVGGCGNDGEGAGMTLEGAGMTLEGAGMTGSGRVPRGWRVVCGGRSVLVCVRTRRTVAAFMSEFLACARAGVNKRNARTHEFSPHFAAFCHVLPRAGGGELWIADCGLWIADCKVSPRGVVSLSRHSPIIVRGFCLVKYGAGGFPPSRE